MHAYSLAVFKGWLFCVVCVCACVNAHGCIEGLKVGMLMYEGLRMSHVFIYHHSFHSTGLFMSLAELEVHYFIYACWPVKSLHILASGSLSALIKIT